MEQTPLEPVTACPICGSARRVAALEVKDHHLTQDVFSLVDCAPCGFRYTDPRPAQNSIGRYYSGEDYFSHDATSKRLLARIYRSARQRALAQKRALIRTHVPHGKLLDVGCGTGDFLAFLSARCYQVEGVEPVLRAREAAIRQRALKVSAALEDVPAQEQFQAITLWHVMEHLHDLNASVKRLYALLAKGGYLLVAVPDRGSWDAAHYGPRWAAWDVPRHLWHFRKQDIAQLLGQHGFELVQTRHMWLDAFYIALLSERYLGRPAMVAWPLAVLKAAFSNLVAIASGRSTSSTLFIAKKP
ncbi:MAG: class I SAM-dependent methyltransferase [Flavobacteriales bacterium]|nr:class I SAM-dependent methyltransferase [Flavobacteriales bacterium]